jgi:hypothetical protein
MVVQWVSPAGAQGSSSSRTLSPAEARKKNLLLELLSSTLLLLVQAVVQPLQVARLTIHWTVKRTLSETRGQEGDD